MGLFSRKSKSVDNMVNYQKQSTNTSRDIDTVIVLQRNNGTEIELDPLLDRTGNQVYETYMNYKGMPQAIPVYNLRCDEIPSPEEDQVVTQRILLDIDPKMLNNEYYKSQIANVLLSSKRIGKVLDEYGGYTGALKLDANGHTIGKTVDAVISENVKNKRKSDAIIAARARKEREEKEVMEIIENAPDDYNFYI